MPGLRTTFSAMVYAAPATQAVPSQCALEPSRSLRYLPLTHAVVGWLKRRANADTSAPPTNFPPFTLRDDGEVRAFQPR